MIKSLILENLNIYFKISIYLINMKAANRMEWHNNYIEELRDIYDIIIKNLRSNYKNNTPDELNHDYMFHMLSIMIFNRSSQQLSEYTKNSLKD